MDWTSRVKKIALSIACLSSLIISQTSEENILSVTTLNEYSSVGYAEVWGWTSPDGHEYALLNPKTGLSIIDLDSEEPSEVGYIPGEPSTWHDVKTYQNYAYTVADEGNQGIQIIDLSSLPNFVGLTSTWYGDGGGNAISQVHNLYIDTLNARMFATGRGTQGIHIIDISDPLKPVSITKITGEAHDMCTNPEGTILVQPTGRSSSLAFWDISDPANPNFLVSINVGSGYSHQCWFHDDGIHLATTIETVGEVIKFWDISPVLEGKEPLLLDEWIAQESIIGHNVHYEKDVLYVAHNNAGSWILDVRDHSDVKVLAHHDPSTATEAYSGTWGIYPWLPSGRVLHSDRSRGLIIFEPDPEVVPIDGSFDPPETGTNPFLNNQTGISLKGLKDGNFILDVYEEGSFRGDIYNTKGKVVSSFPVAGSNSQVLNLENTSITTGKYFIEVGNDKMKFQNHFVVKK